MAHTYGRWFTVVNTRTGETSKVRKELGKRFAVQADGSFAEVPNTSYEMLVERDGRQYGFATDEADLARFYRSVRDANGKVIFVDGPATLPGDPRQFAFMP